MYYQPWEFHHKSIHLLSSQFSMSPHRSFLCVGRRIHLLVPHLTVVFAWSHLMFFSICHGLVSSSHWLCTRSEFLIGESAFPLKLNWIGGVPLCCSMSKIRREGNNALSETLIMLKWSCIICLVGCFQSHSSPSLSHRETPSSALSLRYHGNELQLSRQQLLLLCVFLHLSLCECIWNCSPTLYLPVKEPLTRHWLYMESFLLRIHVNYNSVMWSWGWLTGILGEN